MRRNAYENLNTVTATKSGAYNVRTEFVKEVNCTFCFETVTLICDFRFFDCEFFGTSLEFILHDKDKCKVSGCTIISEG
jgi:hypothetical protein